MKLTESCAIEQHIDRLLKSVEPTNLGLPTPDAAALIVRIVRGWANDTAVATKKGQDADVVLPVDWENAFDQRAWKWPGLHAHSLQRFARRNGSPVTPGSGSDPTMAGLLTARREADGRAQEPCK